jgi:hypothetical protein
MCSDVCTVGPECRRSRPRHRPYNKIAPVREECANANKKREDPEKCTTVRAVIRRGETPCKACVDKSAEKERKEKKDSAKKKRAWAKAGKLEGS